MAEQGGIEMTDLFYEHLVKCKECRETCLFTVSHHTYQKYLDSVDMSVDSEDDNLWIVKQDDNLWRAFVALEESK